MQLIMLWIITTKAAIETLQAYAARAPGRFGQGAAASSSIRKGTKCDA